MAFKSPSINLIKEKKTFIEKFISWALTVGRVVVIVTEGIALSAFLYRFSLDRQIIDLHDKIKQKQQVLAYLKPSEDTFRSLQERLALASKLNASAPSAISAFNDIVQFIPEGLIINNFSISDQVIKIDANSQSIAALSTFIRALRAYKKINSVSLDKIENRTSSSTIALGITIQLK